MEAGSFSREELIELVARIRDARDRGEPDDDIRSLLQRNVKYPDASSICDSDYADDTVVDIILGWENSQRKLTRDGLLQLVREIKSLPAKTEAESILRVATFDYNCLHGAKGDLLFYPERIFAGRPDPTPEEIVDTALTPAPRDPPWERPVVTDSMLIDIFRSIESPEYAAATKSAADRNQFLHAIVFSRPEIGRLMLGSAEVQKKVLERLMQLTEREFEGSENPWDVAMAVYLWVVGKKFRNFPVVAARKVKACRGCRWAKEMAELWTRLEKGGIGIRRNPFT